MWRSRKGSPSEIEGKNSLMVMLPGIEGMTQQLLIFYEFVILVLNIIEVFFFF